MIPLKLKVAPRGLKRRTHGYLARLARLALLIFVANESNPTAYVEASSLKLRVEPTQITVKNGQASSLVATIQNVSWKTQQLRIWSCSYDKHFSSDSKAVNVVPVPCRANTLLGVRLEPGEKYRRELSVHIAVMAEEIQTEALTVRLGFEQATNEGGVVDESLSLIWSNPIRIKVTE
jgi:hypothetical protein